MVCRDNHPPFCNVTNFRVMSSTSKITNVYDVNSANYPFKTRLHSMLCIISFAEMGISVRYGGRH